MIKRKLHKLTILLMIFTSIGGYAESLKKRYDINSEKEIIKSFQPLRPKEVLTWKDQLPKSDRIDLKNDYFNISFPSCIRVEPTIADSEGIDSKTSAALNFYRTEKCPGNDSSLFMSVSYKGNVSKDEIGIFESEINHVVPQILYAQRLRLNGEISSIEVKIISSRSAESMYEPRLAWEINVICKGKKNELFQLGFVSHQGADVEKYLKTNKNFDPPEDFKQIISSFQCKKDR